MRLPPIAWIWLVALIAASMPLAAALDARQPESTDPGDLGLGRLTGGVLTGVLRPMLLSYLWIRADTLYGDRQFEQLRLHYRTLLHLYPRNKRAKEFLGWHLCFNMKSEAPTEAAAWQWAREGLEYLTEIEGAETTVALWFLWQAGQSELQRYAGEGWEAEKRMGANVRKWTEARTGKALDRFEAARYWLDLRRRQDVPRESQTQMERLLGQDIYAIALERIAYDEFVRHGSSGTVGDARRELAQLARLSSRPDLDPAMAEAYRERGRLLADVERAARDDLDPRLEETESNDVAAALWGIGMQRLREGRPEAARPLLELARRIFAAFGEEYYVDEKERLDAWLAHARNPSTPVPKGPFD